MGTAKNKNIKSSKIHKSRFCASRSRRAWSKWFSKKSFVVARRAILVVIALAMMVVILAILTSVFNKPETIVKSKIETVASDYYENYYYEKVLDNTPSNVSMSDVLGQYTKSGVTTVSLRQLMLSDGWRHADAEAVLYNYCDPDETRVQFYPEEPFGKRDYRVEYKYACIF